MTIVKAKLLGTPKVLKNDELITFPYAKAEAIFYYLLVNKRTTRDKLVDLFWGNLKDSKSKKNLRNAIYNIKKTFNEDIFISPQRTIITLNPNIIFEIDLDEFLYGSLNIYEGEFLEGFLIKEADKFDEWLYFTRNKYKEIYIKRLHKEIEASLKTGNLQRAEEYCKKVLEVDEFDENSYRILMDIYRRERKYNKCIDIYDKLVKLLEEELSITPDVITTNLFEEILKERSINEANNRSQNEDFFYGRNTELAIFKNNYKGFIKNEKSNSIIIIGEAGVGKSRIIDKFLKEIEKEDVYIFKSNCYRSEKRFFYKSWNDVFKQLSVVLNRERIEIPKVLTSIIASVFPSFCSESSVKDTFMKNDDLLKYEVIEDAIIDILNRISKKKKAIIVFEDIQWIDSISLILLKTILCKNKNSSIFFITTCREGYGEEIEKFITDMELYHLIEKIILKRFDRNETMEFVNHMVPKNRFSEGIKERIFMETEGNPLFIIEYLDNFINNKHTFMSDKIQNVYRSRLLNVSKEGRKILNIASAISDMITFEDLQIISQKSELEIVDIMDELQRKCFLKEEVDGDENIFFIFTHKKLREYIYNQLSASKRRILHNRIALLYEEKLNNSSQDKLIYPRLIFHFDKGGNKIASLKYRIKNIDEYLRLSQEVFPILSYNDFIDYEHKKFKKDKDISKELEGIQSLYREVCKEYFNNQEFITVEIKYFHMLGRYHNRKGNYEKGLNYIDKMITKATVNNQYEWLLKGYLERIYYCINIYDTNTMEFYISKAFEIVDKKGSKGDLAILLRLKGLYKIMVCDFDEGEDLLLKAIEIFNSLENREKYILNIAAAYSFLGDSMRHRKKYERAISYYNRAISICEERNITRGLAIFNTNAGQAAYDMKDYCNAKNFISKGLELYQKFDFLWGRGIANGYYSLLIIKEGKYFEALRYLRRADKYSKRIKSPYEIGIIFKIKAYISKLIERDSKLKKVFEKYLDKDSKFYFDSSLKYLEKINRCNELGILDEMN